MRADALVSGVPSDKDTADKNHGVVLLALVGRSQRKLGRPKDPPKSAAATCHFPSAIVNGRRVASKAKN